MLTTNAELLNKIDCFIENNKDAILNDLMDLVRIPSVRGEAKENMPFGEECQRMLIETAKLYESHGFASRFDKNNHYIISQFNNGDKTIGIFSHGDVVNADGEWLVCPPFEPVIKDGYMFGRGCNDDKSGIIQALYAAKFIKENCNGFKSNILMFTGANEETGMDDIKEFVKNETMPDFSISPDGEYPYYCGERTIIRFSATSEKGFKSIKNFCGGNAENIVLSEVTAAINYDSTLLSELEGLCKNNKLFSLKYSDNEIIVTAFGKAAHAIHVDKGLNAAKLLCDLLVECKNLPTEDKEILKKASLFIGDGYGGGFNIENDDINFGKLICCNGIVKCNDGKLTLSFDIRAGISFSAEEIEKNIISTCEKADFTVNISRSNQGYIKSETDFGKAINDVYHYIVKPETPKAPFLTAGGTYSRELKNSYSIGTVDNTKANKIDLPEGHGSVHQPDEKLNIKGFLESLKILICILLEADKLLNY